MMPPKNDLPARTTRSGGPPDPAAQPSAKKQKQGQKKNTTATAPVQTAAEQDAELARMSKGWQISKHRLQPEHHPARTA